MTKKAISQILIIIICYINNINKDVFKKVQCGTA